MTITSAEIHPGLSHPEKQLAFIVGQDLEGHWLAVVTHGLGGGFFRSRDVAAHYAREECHRRSGAVQFADEPICLSIR